MAGVAATVSVTLKLPQSVVERVKKEAQKAGLGIEEYVLELVIQSLDPEERASEYVEAAKSLLQQAREELAKGEVRQAAEKVWGAAALAIKAYADWKEGKRLASHRELWEYKRVMEEELGGWVHDAWMNATAMHVCFYEAWCAREDIEEAVKRIERLVAEVERKVSAQKRMRAKSTSTQ